MTTHKETPLDHAMQQTHGKARQADLHDDLRLLGIHLDSLPQVSSLALDLDALLQVLLLPHRKTPCRASDAPYLIVPATNHTL
jgi:hypothetical protein